LGVGVANEGDKGAAILWDGPVESGDKGKVTGVGKVCRLRWGGVLYVGVGVVDSSLAKASFTGVLGRGLSIERSIDL